MRDLSTWRGCRRPEPVSLQGGHVVLERYDAATAEALWNALGGPDGTINDRLRYFPNPPFRSFDDFADWLDRAQGDWITMVARDRETGTVAGMASYMRIDPANGSIEVGSVAHGASMARSPLSTEMHCLMARHVFEDLGYRRYEWKCHNGNEPSKRAAERLGFTFEGVFRQHMVAKGANRDTAWYSIIDSEWPIIGRAMDQWLDPANFRADGRQVRTLQDIRANLTGRTDEDQTEI
jgi:RimJ/RimL family protein N-acetyltransferase